MNLILMTPQLVLRVLILLQTAIGIFTKSNAFGFKDSDKHKIPSIQLALCNQPLFAYILLLILPEAEEGFITKTFDILIVLISLLVWSAWFFKHKMHVYLLLFLAGSIVFTVMLMKYRDYQWVYASSVIAHIGLDYLMLQSVQHYIKEAKTRERRVPKNVIVLLIQTIFEILMFYIMVRQMYLLAMLVTATGMALCITMWLLDQMITVVERPPEPESEIERELLQQHLHAPQGIPELNEGYTGEPINPEGDYKA